VDGVLLGGYSNQEAVELLKKTGDTVQLRVIRYLRGLHFEELKEGIARADASSPSPGEPSPTTSGSSATERKRGTRGDSRRKRLTCITTTVVRRGGGSSSDTSVTVRAEINTPPASALERLKSPSPPAIPSQTPAAGGSDAPASSPSIQPDGDAPSEKKPEPLRPASSKEPSLKRAASYGHKTSISLRQANPGPLAGQKRSQLRRASMPGKALLKPSVVAIGQHADDGVQLLISSGLESHSVPPLEPTWPSEPLEERRDKLLAKWQEVIGSNHEIVVALIHREACDVGLGISLEGTVDVEGGVEMRPHHYVRSILPGGPVHREGTVKPGDELLQVNAVRLEGLFHEDVVAALIQSADAGTGAGLMPPPTLLACCRRESSTSTGPVRGTIVNNVDVGKSKEAFASRVSKESEMNVAVVVAIVRVVLFLLAFA